jgi:hypothetical protein
MLFDLYPFEGSVLPFQIHTSVGMGQNLYDTMFGDEHPFAGYFGVHENNMVYIDIASLLGFGRGLVGITHRKLESIQFCFTATKLPAF